MKPGDKLRAIQADVAVERVEYCRAMLHMHGFLTEGENRRVKGRIRVWQNKAAEQAEKVER